MARKKQRNFDRLVKTYLERPIVLYVGAGSSMGDRNCNRGIPGWWGLLGLILRKAGEDVSRADVKALKEKADPWEAADFVISKMAGPEKRDRFQDALWAIVRDPIHYPDEKNPGGRRYKLMNGEFLSRNATLNAVVAFCGGIDALVGTSGATGYFTCRPNRRVRAVLTTNYDPFLEAASTSKYREALLKPVAAYGSDTGSLRQIPVFHIHGYVPHPHQSTRAIRPFVRDLVMDGASYLEAWNRTDVFGPSMVHQIHFLRGYSVLFIGFSFLDKKVRQLLKDIDSELDGHDRNHFAFVSKGEFDRQTATKADFYEEMGVVPIVYASPRQIPKLLGRLYTAGLTYDHRGVQIPLEWVTTHSHIPSALERASVSASGYWNALLRSRLSRAELNTKAFPTT